MRTKNRKQRRPIHLGKEWAIFFLPLVPLAFIAAGLSIPYSFFRKHLVRRRELRFQESMELLGRVISWAALIKELDKGEGTLIVERFSLKGPIRWWWTTENLYEICPYPLADWLTMISDSDFQSARKWCSERYTGAGGRALLILATTEERRSISEGRGIADYVRWLEVPSPRK